MNAHSQAFTQKRALKHKAHLDWLVVGAWAVCFLALILAWVDYLGDVERGGIDFAREHYSSFGDDRRHR